MKYLISRGSNVQTANHQGDSVLMAAVFKKHYYCAEELLHNPRVRPVHRNFNFDSPLAIAIGNDNTHMIKLLLRAINEDDEIDRRAVKGVSFYF